jgi:hypothetical protein
MSKQKKEHALSEEHAYLRESGGWAGNSRPGGVRSQFLSRGYKPRLASIVRRYLASHTNCSMKYGIACRMGKGSGPMVLA